MNTIEITVAIASKGKAAEKVMIVIVTKTGTTNNRQVVAPMNMALANASTGGL
jgi:outer membrane lipopolysaccharide assembly protein LptE/RlpB